MSSPPRCRRLRQPADFKRVLDRGRRLRGRICTLVVLPGNTTPARLGLAISRKADNRAVRRNRIKRLARESFRRADPPGGDFVIMARPGAGKCPDRAIVADLDQLWHQLWERWAGSSGASSSR